MNTPSLQTVLPEEPSMQFPRRFNIERSRSYSTLAALDKALVKRGFDKLPHTIARNSAGRVTAIFYSADANPVIFHGFSWVHGW